MSDQSENTASRLLDYYHCTFFFPLIGLTEKHFNPNQNLRKKYKVDEHSNDIEAQAWQYFTPFFRDIIFDLEKSENDSIQEWQLDEIEGWKLNLGKEIDKNNPALFQKTRITSVNLYRYLNQSKDLYLLAFRVEPEALVEFQKQQDDKKKEFYSDAEFLANRVLAKKFSTDNRSKDEVDKLIEKEIKEETEEQLRKLLNIRGCPLFRENGPKTTVQAAAKHIKSYQLYRQMELRNWLRFTRLARLICPSFPEQNKEQKIAPLHLVVPSKTIHEFNSKQPPRISSKPGSDSSKIIRYLLQKFDQEEKNLDDFFDNYKNLYDDRMFVSVAYSIAGEALSQENLDKVYQQVLWVDRAEDAWIDGYAYTPSVIKSWSEPQTFSLWEGVGGKYGFTSFSNAYLSRGSFFRELIAPNHIPQLYDRMLIQALFYQSTLRNYDEKISEQTKKHFSTARDNRITPKEREDIKQQRRDFIQFTNCWWHHNLTEQMQGKEIFQLQQSALGLAEHYDIIKDEIERTDEYLQIEHQNRQIELENQQTEYEKKISKLSARLNQLGVNIAIGGLIIGLLATWFTILPVLVEYFNGHSSNSIFTWTASKLPFNCLSSEKVGLFLLVGLPVLVAVMSAIIFWMRKKADSKE